MGLCAPSLPGRIVALLTKLRLPTGYPHSDPEGVLAAMQVDKKAKAGRLRFVLLRGVGQAVISDQVPEEVLREEVARLCQSNPKAER
jgi:3-dehydroquinate synthase